MAQLETENNFPNLGGGEITIEKVLLKISEALITSNVVDANVVRQNQKVIKNGKIDVGRTNDFQKVILYEKISDANKEDFKTSMQYGDNSQATLETIVNSLVGGMNNVDIQIITNSYQELDHIIITNNDRSIEVTDLLTTVVKNPDGSSEIVNPLNVSQFINISQKTQTIDTGLANEFLNTRIYELLPDRLTRQQKIDRLFRDFQELKGPLPQFDVTDGLVSDDFNAENYYLSHDISAQD